MRADSKFEARNSKQPRVSKTKNDSDKSFDDLEKNCNFSVFVIPAKAGIQ